MKLSINWLNKFLSLDDTEVTEVANRLSTGSFEVEELHKIGPKLKEPIVVGEILEIHKHPNADRLSIAAVTTDNTNKIQIVCGATNIKVGQKVPVSLPGAIVQNRNDGSELLVKTTKIRGIESFGMLCSPSELGINVTEQEGILILPASIKLGESVIDYLTLNQDIVLEIATRSNRGDGLSVFGLAREISALTSKKLKEIQFKPPQFDKLVINVPSRIEDLNDTCLFYTVTIEGINICESPLWLKKLLSSVGIKSINNIVDITNYINLSFGQPLHAYDRAKLSLNTKSGFLTARLAKNGEKITTLDGKTRELNKEVLVIADERKPVAIAGIMGEKESEVTENTTDIVLEAAVFNPVRVRRGSRIIGLTSEASKRFERGVDSNFTYNALLSAIELIQELARNNTKKLKIGELQQAGSPVKEEISISLTKQDIKKVLGIQIDIKEAKKWLELLNFKTKLLTENKIEVDVPTFRARDIKRPIDLIEEIARLYGYDNIPQEPPPATIAANKTINCIEKLKGHFLASGFSETYLSSLIGEQILSYKEFPCENSSLVNMINPLSKEHCVLRQWLIPGLLEALKLNQSHKNNFVKLFEIGKSYSYNKNKSKNKSENEKETNVNEVLRIAGLFSGYEDNWFSNQYRLPNNLLEQLFFTGKGIIEGLLTNYKCKYSFINSKEEFLNPNFALQIIFNGMNIGRMGCLHPYIEKIHKLQGPIFIFEMNLDELLQEIDKAKTFEKISSQPIVERDITIDLLGNYPVSSIRSEIAKAISSFVIDIKLVSVYKLDKETRSLTYRFKMQDFEGTLTTKQIEDEVNKIKKHLTACFQAKFRV